MQEVMLVAILSMTNTRAITMTIVMVMAPIASSILFTYEKRRGVIQPNGVASIERNIPSMFRLLLNIFMSADLTNSSES